MLDGARTHTFLLDTIETHSLASFLSTGGNMAPEKGGDKSRKKQTIEFDMFVRDLEPDKDDKIRGGGKTGDQQKPDALDCAHLSCR